MPMGWKASHTQDTYTLPRPEALSNRAGVRGRRERLAILPLGLDIDEDLPAKRSERLLLLEYFSKAGRGKPMGMGAEFAGDG
jgi:hypothetical protein